MSAGSGSRSALTTVVDAWNRFFFAEVRLDSLALVRILLCAAVLIPAVGRWVHAREMYSSDGLALPFLDSYPVTFELPVLGGGAVVAVYTALVFFLIAGLIGWFSRLSLGAAAVLLVYFGFLDQPGTLTKYTIIAGHMLAVLACSRCGAVWSVDAAIASARRNGSRPESEPSSPRGAIWPLRVIQLFLALMYFGCAVTKVKAPEYLSGEHTLFWMQSDMNFAHPLGFWMSTQPDLVIYSAYLVILWETLFCALCWNRWTLYPMLAVGAIFHAMTYFLLGLLVFPLVMLALYPAFLPPEQIRSVLLRVRSVCHRLPQLPAIELARYAWTFPVLLGVVIATAVEAEYHLDPMGTRAEKPQLPVISKSVVNERLQTSGPNRPAEWIFRFDVGKLSAAGILCGESERFGPDDTVQLQLWVHRPHPDFYVHVDVHDVSDRPVMQDGTAIPREANRHTVPFSFANNLPPGQYAFVVRDEVGLVARHPFRIVN